MISILGPYSNTPIMYRIGVIFITPGPASGRSLTGAYGARTGAVVSMHDITDQMKSKLNNLDFQKGLWYFSSPRVMKSVAPCWFVNPAKSDNDKEIKRMKNPKRHDSLFKWLIASFTEEFFKHYFPSVRIGAYRSIDKEFIQKYEALKESLKGDLFMVMDVEIEGAPRDIVIQIEHKSERKDVREKVYEYSCYAWLLERKPVWSIVIFTDEAMWRKPVPDAYWFAFDSENKKQFHHFDVIKVKEEKSSDLIKKHSMLCKLLALKANDKGADPEQLVYEIYRTASEMKHILRDEQRLLIDQWVNAYKKVSDQKLKRIKEEVKMTYVATTIKEHIQYESEMIGEKRGVEIGEKRGVEIGEKRGEIKTLEGLHAEGFLSKEQFEKKVVPLRRELKELLDGKEGRDRRKPDHLTVVQ